jgi:hypothetical protein
MFLIRATARSGCRAVFDETGAGKYAVLDKSAANSIDHQRMICEAK